MNTSHIKRYAPTARRDFMTAVTQRLNLFGIFAQDTGLRLVEPLLSGSVMQINGVNFAASLAPQRLRLIARAQAVGFAQLVEQVAYTWFNRLCALRFMELQGGYLAHGLRVLSHPQQPRGFEILDQVVDVAAELGLDQAQVIQLKLAGDQDEPLYRLVLLAQCRQLHQAMPFLFEALDDETELLLPDHLTRTDSLIRALVDEIPEDDWAQVEVIGWLYQFYISEKKDLVIGKVVNSEDIPAATQLFTPNWIVQYLVQNSVGRQWMQTYPESGLAAQMPYYIAPAEQSAEVQAQLAAMTPSSLDPEQIKVLDPACGSGHILVEAYRTLFQIYTERGYKSRDIPQLILQHNLFGLDLDDRAAQLSGFALMMLARADDRRIFSRDVRLNVLALQSSAGLNVAELWRDLGLGAAWQSESLSLFADDQPTLADEDRRLGLLREVVGLFTQAKTFGSLIDVPAGWLEELLALQAELEGFLGRSDVIRKRAAGQVLPLLRQAVLLAQRYDAVVANPPYMGGGGMNASLKDFAKKKYPDSKSDLFAMFMEKGFTLLTDTGFNAQVNMQSWMFLSSYEKMREKLISNHTFITMAHLGSRAFSQISGEVVQTTAFVMTKPYVTGYQPTFFRLIDGNEEEKQRALLNREQQFSHTKQDDFKKIPASPIAYWVSERVLTVFKKGEHLKKTAPAKIGMRTGDNEKWLRKWFEVSYTDSKFNTLSTFEPDFLSKKWFPYNKGGDFRRWYGNNETVIFWENNGYAIKLETLEKYPQLDWDNLGWKISNEKDFFKKSCTWSFISSSSFGVRVSLGGAIFDVGGSSAFPKNEDIFQVAGFLCSKISFDLLKLTNPTLNFQVANINLLPWIKPISEYEKIEGVVKELINHSKSDWDAYERSWDFARLPILSAPHKQTSLAASYTTTRAHWQYMTDHMQQLEQDNNRIFIDAYGLQDELTPDVPLKEITLTCNPHYRYGGDKTHIELEQRLQSDTAIELISYAIGCMMGRYSLDQDGLIYAHAGNHDFDPSRYPSFPADDDGILPMTDTEWFKDDIANRIREFIRSVWGAENLNDNLKFLSDSLKCHEMAMRATESPLETIRRYLPTSYYKNHLKTYKKRPIYWLFSSGKQKAFEALVYLHRYNDGTLARMRTEYVAPLLGKYIALIQDLNERIEHSTSTSEKTQLNKQLAALEKKQTELHHFDDQLKHYADMRISLDLDDGVKVNYAKFGNLLAEVKSVTGGSGD